MNWTEIMTKCICCETRDVNIMIGSGKSFCSRICESLWWDETLKGLTFVQLKELADKQHNQLKELNHVKI